MNEVLVIPHSIRKSAVVVAAVLYLALNLATATRQPVAFVDEVMYADPAANLLLHGHWRSGAWFAPPTDFWSGNAPLYPLLLVGWMRLLGIGIWQARSLNYPLMALAVVVFVSAVRRSGRGREGAATACLGIACLSADAFHVAYRYGRPDVLAALCVAVWFWCATSWSKHHASTPAQIRTSLLGAYVSTAAMFAASYPTGIMASLLALVALFADRTLWKRFRAPLVAGLLGMLSAGLALLALFAAQGVLYGWVYSMRTHSGSALRDLQVNEVIKGYAVPGLWATVVVSALVVRWLRNEPGARLRAYLWATCAFMPFVPLLLRGTVPSPGYLWQSFVPLAWLLFAEAWPLLSAARRLVLVGLTVFLVLSGTPLRLANAVQTWEARDYRPVERFVAAVLTSTPEDVLLDHGAYFATVPRARMVFTSTVLPNLSMQDRARITLILTTPENAPTYVRTLGGCWRLVGVLGSQSTSMREPPAVVFVSRRYEFVALRRTVLPFSSPCAYATVAR